MNEPENEQAERLAEDAVLRQQSVPDTLLIGRARMHIAEVTKRQLDKAMTKYQGEFFGIEYEQKCYLQGAKVKIDAIKSRF